MATIDIRYPHKMTLEDAKVRTHHLVTAFAEEKREYIKTVEWHGDLSATAIGRGFSGRFTLTPTHVNIAIDLSFLLRAFKTKVETRLMQRLAIEFGEQSV